MVAKKQPDWRKALQERRDARKKRPRKCQATVEVFSKGSRPRKL